MTKKQKKDEYTEIWEGIKDKSSRLDEFQELHFRDYFRYLERISETSAVQSDLIDSIRFSRVYKNSRQLNREISYCANTRGYSVDAAAYQLWASLYNGVDPMIRPNVEVDSIMGDYFKESIAEMADTLEYKNLAEKTEGSPTYSTMAAMSMLDSFCNYIDKSLERDGTPQPGGKDDNDDKDEDGDPNPGGDSGNPGADPIDKDQITEAMINALSDIKENLNKTKNDIDESGKISSGAGANPPGDKDTDPSAYIDEYEKMDMSFVKRVLNDVGKLELSCEEGVGKLVRSRGGRRTYSLGSSLSALPEYELAKFVDEDLSDLLLMDLASSEAVQLTDTSPASRGPIIVCVDISGSMQGGRDVTARAIALATVKLSMSTNRHVDVILFDTKGALFNMSNSEDVFKMLSVGPGGGTDFDVPMGMALKRCNELRKTRSFSRADILFITDGDCSFSEKENLVKLNQSAKADVYVLQVGQPGGWNSSAIEDTFLGLSSFVSKVDSVEDFSSSRSVREFWKSVLTIA